MSPPQALTAPPPDQSITETHHLAGALPTGWTAVRDPALIAQCVPGARLTSTAPDHLTGELSAALGPIRAHFTGTARVTYRADHTGTVDGEGQDLATRTHLRASATFALIRGSLHTHADHHLRATRPVGAAWPRSDRARLCRRTCRDRRPHSGSPAVRHRDARHGVAFLVTPAPAAATASRAATFVTASVGAIAPVYPNLRSRNGPPNHRHSHNLLSRHRSVPW